MKANMKKERFTQKMKVAYHEAGHAVMCYIEKVKFRYVTIIPNEKENFAGALLPEKFRDTSNPEYVEDDNIKPLIEKRVLVSFAGGIATYILTGRHDHRGSEKDYLMAHNIATKLCGPNDQLCQKYLDWLRVRCEDTMIKPVNQYMVEILASMLLEHGTIGYFKARKIIIEAEKEFFDTYLMEGTRPNQLMLEQKKRWDNEIEFMQKQSEQFNRVAG